MKIAFIQQPIGTISPSALGGSIGIWIYEVARRLVRSSDVIVYAKMGRRQKKIEYDQEVKYKRITTAIDELITYILSATDKLLAYSKCSLFASPLYYIIYCLQVSKNLKAEKCDIVHLHNFSQLVPIIRALNPKIKIVLHMHCEWLTQLDREMIERRLKEVDLIISCSKFINEKICHRFPRARCKTIYNGVDINQFFKENRHSAMKKKGSKRLLFVGRNSPEKGLHVLLDAFQKVADHFPRVQLEIVGPQKTLPIEWAIALSDNPRVLDLASFYIGSYLSNIKDKLSSSGLANQVSFNGFIPRPQLINYNQNADVFVFPSVWNEPFGMPLIEAMATEVPVVATRVGGIPEIVEEGTTGLLVEPNNSSALAEAIIHLLSDEDLRKTMGKNSRKRAVDLFSWDKVAENLLYQYKDII